MNEICYKLGDCGGYINWQNKYTEDGYAAYFNEKRVAGAGGSEILEKEKKATTSTTGTGTATGTGGFIPGGTTTPATGGIVANIIKNLFGK